MRRSVLILVAVATLGLAAVADGATKRQIVNRSAEICANGDRAMQPYDDRAEAAAKRGDRRAFLRNARRSLRIGRTYLARLADLNPPPRGRRYYRNFVERTRTMTNWLDGASAAQSGASTRPSARAPAPRQPRAATACDAPASGTSTSASHDRRA
jgi:hypothetical protein